MTFLKKLSAALAAVVLGASAAHASTLLNDWVFAPEGQGFDSGQQVVHYLDTNGNLFLQTQRMTDDRLALRERGVFNMLSADSNGWLFPMDYPGGNITGIFDLHAIGKLGGAYTYTGGSLRLYQNPVGGQYGTEAGIHGANLGRLIAELDVRGGVGGLLNEDGSLVNNDNSFMLIAQGRLADGYFFRGDRADLAHAPNVRVSLSGAKTYGFPDELLLDELACQYAGFTGPGCNGQDFQPSVEYALVGLNGQLKLAEVPEPGSAALFGLALFGAAAARRLSAARKGQAA